jgi:alpha/beta superfamily hydrolase
MTAIRSTTLKRLVAPLKPLAAAVAVLLLALAGCDGDKPSARKASGPTSANPPRRSAPAPRPPEPATLAEARQGFRTTLLRQESAKEPVPTPPAASGLQVVRYDSPAGSLAAYLSKVPADGKKHPAIVWVFGGFDNGIGDTAWERATPDNDQSAAAFRQAGVVTMYPSFRGGNDNPGFKEGLYGEVDDVLAAADFLAKQPGVDPARVYLGGHSTGGTLALLAAATGGSRFRAVFSFGPIDNVARYGADSLPFDADDERELLVRAPIRCLADVSCPTFVFEGDNGGNVDALRAMSRASQNPLLHFYPIPRMSHFSVLSPGTRVVAAKVARDTGPAVNLTFSPQEFVGRTGGR